MAKKSYIAGAKGQLACFTTCPGIKEARAIARALVKEKLAACVNILGKVSSIYRWMGKVEEASEILLIIKTEKRLKERLSAKIRSLHSYEVPEIIFFKLDSGSKKYLDWMNNSVA